MSDCIYRRLSTLVSVHASLGSLADTLSKDIRGQRHATVSEQHLPVFGIFESNYGQLRAAAGHDQRVPLSQVEPANSLSRAISGPLRESFSMQSG